MRTLTANHAAAQVQDSRRPYIRMVFTSAGGAVYYNLSTDGEFGSRILMIDHWERPYSCLAYILLQNYDRSIPDLTGYWTEIGYGDAYLGDTYYELTSRLWVKKQHTVSTMGRIYTLLELHGVWDTLDEQAVLIGDPPLYQDEFGVLSAGNLTVREMMVNVLVHLMTRLVNHQSLMGVEDIGDNAIGQTLDGIINTYKPKMLINQQEFESTAAILRALIQMTKCVVRVRASNVMDILFPQDDDSIDKTFYSDRHPYFYEHRKIDNVTTPNMVIVYGKIDPYLDWPGNWVAGTAVTDGAQMGKYIEAREVVLEPLLSTAEECTERAGVILERLKRHDVTGELVIPHDASLELFDFIEIHDYRGAI